MASESEFDQRLDVGVMCRRPLNVGSATSFSDRQMTSDETLEEPHLGCSRVTYEIFGRS